MGGTTPLRMLLPKWRGARAGSPEGEFRSESQAAPSTALDLLSNEQVMFLLCIVPHRWDWRRARQGSQVVDRRLALLLLYWMETGVRGSQATTSAVSRWATPLWMLLLNGLDGGVNCARATLVMSRWGVPLCIMVMVLHWMPGE